MISSIPVVGGFLDMFYKANLWNYEALVDYVNHTEDVSVNEEPSSSSSSSTEQLNSKYQDIASTEISWTQMFCDIRHIGTTFIHWIYPYVNHHSKKES